MYVSLRLVGSQHLPAQLEHGYIVASSTGKKLAALRRILKKIMSSCRENAGPKKVLVFSESHRPLEEIAKVLAKDADGIYWNVLAKGADGIYWNEQTASTAALSGDGRGTKAEVAIVSVLRYEDSLSERAVAMDAFRGEVSKTVSSTSSSYTTASVSIDGGNSPPLAPSVLLRVMLSTDLAACGLDTGDGL